MRSGILYQDVAAAMKKDILSDRYPVGSLVPTENELVEQYQVSKITVRKAEELLVEEGYLEKRSGIGTRVISNNLFNKLSKADSFTSILGKEGKDVTKRIIDITTMDATDLPFEHEEIRHRVTRVRRVYSLDGQPYILFTHYLLFTDQAEAFNALDTKSLYRLLRDLGAEVDTFKDSFEAVALTPLQQSLLDSNQQLAIQRVRKSFDRQNHLVEYSKAVYLTALEPYQINFEV